MNPIQSGPARLHTTKRTDTPFLVVYRDPTKRVKTKTGWRSKRIQKWFKELPDAEKYRDQLNEKLLAEGAAGVAFDAVLRADAIGARRKLDIAGHDVSLVWLAEQFCGRVTKASASGELIGPVIEAFLADKEFVDGRSDETTGNLKRRVWQWINREHINVISDITPESIERVRRRQAGKKGAISARTRINDLAAISSFCTFLFDQKKIPFHPVRGLKRPHAPVGAKQTFTVPEVARVLSAAMEYRDGKKSLGSIAALLFVGPRPSELKETQFSYGRPPMARIIGGKLRGRANRIVKLTPAAAAWLRAAGKPTAVKDLSRKARANICRIAKVKWSEDICRHTAISYRAAVVKNDGAVAREFGTSEATIFKHYHKPMLELEAKKFQALRPAKTLTSAPAPASIAA